jgi:hypothetical protein
MMKKNKPRTKRDPMGWVKKRMSLDQSKLRDIGVPVHLAIEAMRTGHGEQGEAWGILAGSVNVALLLAENGIGNEYIGQIKEAQAALMRCRERAERTSVWAFDGDGYNAVASVIDLHEQQLAEGNVGVIERALYEGRRRVDCGEVLA